MFVKVFLIMTVVLTKSKKVFIPRGENQNNQIAPSFGCLENVLKRTKNLNGNFVRKEIQNKSTFKKTPLE